MARNTLKLDTSVLNSLIVELDKVDADTEKVIEITLKKAAVQIMNDTIIALNKPNLPAQGKYWRGQTDASVVHWPTVEWDGTVAWVPVGFDYAKPGAGGFLIRGTPRMSPDVPLKQMYTGKKYMSGIHMMMQDEVWKVLLEAWEE